MESMKGFFRALVRKKPIRIDYNDSQLKRCLSTLDLTALGIGSTLGLGIYVLAGQVASDKAGPAVTLSFFIAAVASVFAGLCYAEFGARVPRAGSAYVYSYVTVGEFMAFIIGWNLILEYVIGTASVARGYSGYIDALFNGTIQKHLQEAMPMYITDVSPYPDFLALGITLLLTVMLAAGVKESSRFNNLFTGINLLVVIFAIVAGSLKADVSNWKLEGEALKNVTSHGGEGGFFPFGISGMMAGAATCFYGFIGFDCIATTGEEVKNPQKSIPISIVLSLLFIFLAYFGVSAVQTLMVPYYLQNNPAPLPYVFSKVGWSWASWIISIGALAGLSTSLLGAMFPLPRVLYAMGTDGVIFRVFAKVHPRLQTPLIATIFSGIFAGVMAMMFNVQELADMMSIGTLLAYTLVAVSVLVLRYKPEESSLTSSPAGYRSVSRNDRFDSLENTFPPAGRSLSDSVEKITSCKFFRQLLNLDRYKAPTKTTSKVSNFLIVATCVFVSVLDAVLALATDYTFIHNAPVLSSVIVLVVIVITLLIMLYRQPAEDRKLSFKVPCVPFIPVLSIFVNVFLMFKLSLLTWKRFGVWMLIGLCIYFFYGLWHSSERRGPNAQTVNTTENMQSLVGRNDSLANTNSTCVSRVNSPLSEFSATSEPMPTQNAAEF